MSKVCTKCGVEKDEGEFYRNKAAKDGLHVYCKACANAYVASRARLRSENRKQIVAKWRSEASVDVECKPAVLPACYRKFRGAKENLVSSLSKTCTKCKVEKSLDEFPRNRGRSDGRHSWCKSCNVEAARLWSKNNPDRCMEHVKAHYYANREKILSRERSRRKDDPERYRAYGNARVRELRDSYVRARLGLGKAEVPASLIDLKRCELKIKRFIKQKENDNA